MVIKVKEFMIGNVKYNPKNHFLLRLVRLESNLTTLLILRAKS